MEFKFITFKKIRVFYTDELDGGGTTFGQDYLPFIKRLSKRKFNRIYEWCAGPGFIGFSLLANGYCESLCLSDIHPKAIQAIKKTIKYNKLENKVSVYNSDSLDDIPEKEKWDLVVGNPPHYKKKPTSYTSKGVAANGLTEDQMRIVLDLNLETHKKFFKKVRNYLNKDGIVLLQENWFRVALDEFKEISDYLNNTIDLSEAKDQISIKTRQYAKRQFTWFRGHMRSWESIYSSDFNDLFKQALNKIS